MEYLKVNGRKINADYFKRYWQETQSVNGKPLNVNENDGMENSEKASSYQMAESTEASNDNQMIFVKEFRDCFCTI